MPNIDLSTLQDRAEDTARLNYLETQVSALTAELASTKAHLSVARQQVEGYRDYLDRAHAKADRLQAQINEIDAALLVAVRPIWRCGVDWSNSAGATDDTVEIPGIEERIEMLAVAAMKVASK